MVKKNIILTGEPQSGKSTLLEKILVDLSGIHGVLTREIRNNGGGRIGFEMSNHLVKNPSDEQFCIKETIAHVNFRTDKKVSRYHVDTNAIKIVLLGMADFLSSEAPSSDTLLYVDEVGEMQLFSREFKKMVKTFLDSHQRCLMTMTSVFNSPFIESIKKRDDVLIISLTKDNRDQVENEIKKLLSVPV